MEVLFEEAPAMAQQPDMFWVQYAGFDPMAYLEAHRDRIKMIHLKQLEDMDSKKNVYAGSGIIDLKGLMNKAPDIYFIYE